MRTNSPTFGDVESETIVHGNDWRILDVDPIGSWQPTLPVSVVIPHYNRPDELNLTLAGLTTQTYPNELLEVVVVDDGSTRPPDIPSDLVRELDVKVVHQKRQGFGAPRARNRGAAEASGVILVYLDCDMVPERQLVEAHARWHHQIAYAVTIGFRRHVEFDGIDVAMVQQHFAAGASDSLFEGSTIERPEWFEAHLTRTEDLTTSNGFFRVMSGGNLGIRRAFYLEVGGMDEAFDRWGGEDNEFGFRTLLLGGVVIPEREAEAWHQGPGHVPSEEEAAELRIQLPKMQHLMPELGFRNPRRGRRYEIPHATIAVETDGRSTEEIAASIDSILAGSFTDVAIYAPLPSNSDDLWLERLYACNDRVMLDADADPWQDHPLAALRMTIPAGIVVSRPALGTVASMADGYELGAVHLVVPRDSETTLQVHATATRASNRVHRLTADGDAIATLVGELFGERWLSGPEFGFHWHDDAAIAEGLEGGIVGSAQLESVESEIQTLDSQIADLASRRALQLADALGTISHARSWPDLREATRTLGDVVRRPRRYEPRSAEEIRAHIRQAMQDRAN